MKKLFFNILILAAFFCIVGCKKNFLDTKPSSSIVIPTTLNDLRNLLENSSIYNATAALPLLACDEYYYRSYTGWQAAETSTERNSYIWAKDVYGGEVNIKDWNAPYSAIFYSNNVLDQLSSIQDSVGSTDYNFIKGWAYFIRGYELFDLVRNFAPAYDSTTATTDLGVPIKLQPGIDDLASRSSVQECFDQIIADVKASLKLLPEQYPTNHQNHPSTLAGYALLARIYLYIRDYKDAYKYSDSCLAGYNYLIDYNTVSASSNYPFPNQNNESLFTTCQVIAYISTINGLDLGQDISIDTSLLRLYQSNDLRKSIFFINSSTDQYIMNGGYYGTGLYSYSGLAVDEMYLIRAECLARAGEKDAAIADLNTLLEKRFRTGSFHPLVPDQILDVLQSVLEERRKELIWRAIRWSDLKRLNKEGADITLTRILNGQTYTLPPNDPRYVFNIPADEIALSGIKQNIR